MKHKGRQAAILAALPPEIMRLELDGGYQCASPNSRQFWDSLVVQHSSNSQMQKQFAAEMRLLLDAFLANRTNRFESFFDWLYLQQLLRNSVALHAVRSQWLRGAQKENE